MGSDTDSAAGVERVLDALTPFANQAGTMSGFSVRFAATREDAPEDTSVVEVRVRFPERHPKDADVVMGILQGHGYHPERRRMGTPGGVCVVLSVPVTADGEPREWGEDAVTGEDGEEQTTF